MGEIKTAALTVSELAELNPCIHPDVITVFVDALTVYREASENILKNGAVTGHPKTGAPITNPYMPIREKASKSICRFHRDNPQFYSGGPKPVVASDDFDLQIGLFAW